MRRPPAPAGAGWRLARVVEAPHRLLFTAGALLWAASAAWWALLMAAAALGRPLPMALPARQAHALLMTLGFLPLFFAGFLFTAGPRWLQAPAPAVRRLRGPTLAAAGGLLLALPAAHLGARATALALLPAVVGHGLLVRQLVQLCRQGQAGRRLHAGFATAGSAVCALAGAGAAAALWWHNGPALAALLALALWCGVGTVFVAAAHRMSPWLGGSRLWPWLAGLAAQGLASAGNALGRPTPPAMQALLALGLSALAVRGAWGLRSASLPHGHRTTMLRMLRAGAGWLVAALGCSAAAAAARLVDGAGAWPPAFALAATHALALGFGGGHLLTMASRVTAVHSGRPVALDAVVWRLHGLLQLVALGRVAAALGAPAGAPAAWIATGLAATALGWAALALGWAARHGRWLGQPGPHPPASRHDHVSTADAHHRSPPHDR